MSGTVAAQIGSARGKGFWHEPLFYAGSDDFLDGTTAFIREALAAAEPCLVVVDADKIRALRGELGSDAEGVTFADMADVGANPARIIPAWRGFADEHGDDGGGIWGIGEPVWPGRSRAELAECHRHEALLNLAFADHPGFNLLCPYDEASLDDSVLAQAHHTHGRVDLEQVAEPFAAPLAEPAVPPRELAFERGTLRRVRRFVGEHAREAGVGGSRLDDLVLAIDELASNSVRHGAGRGLLRIWREDETLFCEVRDDGPVIADPLVGRVRPPGDRIGGYGMWLVNQLCDLVQVRTSRAGNAVRVHTKV